MELSFFLSLSFFRTPPVHKDEQIDDPCAVLARHLPKQAHTIIFGSETAPHRKEIASEVSAKRRIPALSIYIVSTNQEHESGIHFLFRDIPARIFKLAAPHFFSKEEGAYEGIGVDRVSALYACKAMYPRRHCLVFDAGTAWTYTVLDHNGQILGGGISPGVGARFRSMSDYCGNLPVIEHSTYHNALLQNLEKNEPFPIFAKDTQIAMMTSVFSEIANQCRCLVKHFLGRVEADDVDGKEGKPVIAIAGGDAPFLQKVLQKDFSGVVANEPGTSMPIGAFDIQEAKHLVHYGIGHLLDKSTAPGPSNDDDALRELLNGTRIAKRFPLTISYDGNNVFRGSIMGIKAGLTLDEDIFHVRYDDGDAEQLDLTEIYGKKNKNRVKTGLVWSAPSADTLCFLLVPCQYIDAFKLYLEVGEMVNGEKLKVDQLTKSVAQMDEKIPKLKNEEQQRAAAREEEVKRKQEVEAKRKQAQSAKRSRAPSKGGPPAKKIRKGNDTNGENKKTMYINKRVAKGFEGGAGESEIFFGTIDKITNAKEPFYWHITYDDDDEEEFDEMDITKGLKLYQMHRAKDRKFGELTRAPVAAAPVAAAPVAVAAAPKRAVAVAAAPKPVEASAATKGNQFEDAMEVDKATPAPPESVVEATPAAAQAPTTQAASS
jgi:pantothenate kinase type III